MIFVLILWGKPFKENSGTVQESNTIYYIKPKNINKVFLFFIFFRQCHWHQDVFFRLDQFHKPVFLSKQIRCKEKGTKCMALFWKEIPRLQSEMCVMFLIGQFAPIVLNVWQSNLTFLGHRGVSFIQVILKLIPKLKTNF